ncbi:hypothetical protein HBH69_234610 [Parastagonospora nodorum]|nr:hypothetical protein HBH49_224390 [Parastagonospora nodorum]KAH4181087.1 hypothetical protein HBH42_241630 [Parastagonospora nodorum]KAH5136838.1 hypothetical protein HBH69_234610 [Parastagonospora nodorum]KAH5349747.1 hypothetical protein HBI33_219470 [Parastagonospora nodorum]KAH5467719.1 hypothetical protein HBI28_196600 [Parastagonospora nodorum]
MPFFPFQKRKAGPVASPVQYQQNDKGPIFTTLTLDDDSTRRAQPTDFFQRPAKQPLLSQQSLEYRGHDGSEQSSPTKPWRPLMLRRWVLVLFSLVFALLVMTLEIILKVSSDRDGFASTESNLYYVYTYGPTAVLTIIAAFWTQVEYRTRQMQPWEEMAKGPQSVANSLLLDYISPNPVLAFIRSCKNRHLPVTLTLFASFLLKVLIVISTGVFTRRLVLLPQPLPISPMEQFQFSGHNASKVDDVAGLASVGPLLNEIDYLPGTNAEYAVELFRSSNQVQADNYNMTGESKILRTDLECEPATIDRNVTVYCPDYTGCTTAYNILRVHNNDCHMSAFPNDNTSFVVDNRTPFGRWYGGVLPGTCDGPVEDTNRDRLVVFVLHKVVGPQITNSTALFCKPSVQLQQSTITMDQNGVLINVENGTALPTPAGLTSFISDAVLNTVEQLDNNFLAELARKYPIRPQNLDFANVFAGLIMRTMDSNDMQNFWDSEKMSRGAQKIFTSVAAQVAKRYLLVTKPDASATQSTGKATYRQERLFVRRSTMRAMEALFCALVLLCLYLGLRPVRRTTPQDPASIARLASMLSQSENLNLLMSNAGFVSLESIESLLSGKYGLVYAEDFVQHASRPQFMIESCDTDISKPISVTAKPWQPISAMWISRIALLVVPLGIVVALEVLFRQSERNHGLLDVSSSKWTQYGSSFVPALVMVMIKLQFSGSDFDLHLIDPYVQLKKGFARAKTSVLDKTIYTWKADAVWTAFVNGRIAVGASTFSVVVASFLTIAVSGLYNTVPMARQEFTNVTRLDSFYDPASMLSGLNATFNYTTALSARLVVYDQMVSSQWTSESYVLPNLTSTAETTETANNVSSITVDLPVRRGALTCRVVPQDQLVISYEWFKKMNQTGADMNWPMLNQYNCTGSTTNGVPTVSVSNPGDGPFGEWSNFDFDYSNRSSPYNDRPCPTSYGLYGTWQGKKAKELNVVLCWSSVQELQASARFSMPGWRLRSLQADEQTVRNISATPDTQLDMASRVFGGSKGNVSTSLDNVFTAFLRNSTTNTMETSLLQLENWDKLYARMNSVYGRAAAQIMSREGRFTNLTSTSTTIPAQQTSYSTHRLRQNLVSTRVLQGLLIAMIVCALISLLTIDLRNVLPKNPCSIAAQASLVAGSQMMKDLPTEAQWMSDKEFEKLFEGGRYRMGWSGEGEEERFGIDADARPRVQEETGWKKWLWR